MHKELYRWSTWPPITPSPLISCIIKSLSTVQVTKCFQHPHSLVISCTTIWNHMFPCQGPEDSDLIFAGPGDSGRSITCLTGACAKWRHEYAKWVLWKHPSTPSQVPQVPEVFLAKTHLRYSETIVQRGCAEKSDWKQMRRNIGKSY